LVGVAFVRESGQKRNWLWIFAASAPYPADHVKLRPIAWGGATSVILRYQDNTFATFAIYSTTLNQTAAPHD
jgi:hypothetical protein